MPRQEQIDKSELTLEADWNSLYIGGEWRSSIGSEEITIENPATGQSIATVPSGTEADINAAYEAAEAAQPDWQARPPGDRRAVIDAVVDLLENNREELKDCLIAESGSTHLKSQGELDIATAVTRHARTFPDWATGQHSPSDIPGKENLVTRVPKGIVGVISPWNYPIHLALRTIAPAIALGNTVVLKPSEETPVTGGLLLAKLFEEAGLPDGVLNVVPGYGEEAGARTASHPDIDVLSFTGSTAVGRKVAKSAVTNLALPTLELGGNNPHIVLDGANLEQAAAAGAFGTFIHQGQVCISINRHLVHESVYDDYVEKLVNHAKSLTVGDPADPETDIGPIVNKSQRDQVVRYLKETVDAGASVEVGGSYDDLFVEPTVLSGVSHGMPASCNEHFGPIAPVISVSSEEEAVTLANDTEYGLAGSVHAGSLETARRVANQIDAGMVHVGDQPMNTEPEYVPFGGMKDSGIGRYNGQEIHRELTDTKWISIQHEPRDYPL